jgi:hypothetical protein
MYGMGLRVYGVYIYVLLILRAYIMSLFMVMAALIWRIRGMR